MRPLLVLYNGCSSKGTGNSRKTFQTEIFFIFFFFCLGCLCRLIAVGHAVRHSKKENYQKVKQAASLSRATPRYAVNCTT